MRISGVRVTQVERTSLLRVELETGEGPTGRALCVGAAPGEVHELANAVLRGRDPRAVSGLWDALGAAGGGAGSRSPGYARAALDIACWDLKSRINGEPLWKTLGGHRPRAVAFGSWQRPLAADEEPRGAFRRLASPLGLRGGLLHLGADAGDDARLLGALQETLREHGAPVELMLDFGEARPGEAIQRIRALETVHDIAWVRRAAPAGDLDGCKRVAAQVRAGVCAGGDLASERAFLPLLDEQAANVIEVNLQRLGITGALRVAEAAFGFELPVILSATPGDLGVHLASALPNCMGLEVVDAAIWGGAVGTAARFEAGRAIAGDAPGTAIDVDTGSRPGAPA